LASKKSKSAKKAPQKVEVVFEGSDKIINTKKPVTKKKATKHKVSFEKTPAIKHEVNKHEAHKEEAHSHVHKTNKTKDYIIIGVLSLLIIGIIVIAFLVPTDFSKKDKDITTPVDQNIILDNNQSTDVNVEDFEKRSLEMTLTILKDMREYQKNILEENYELLGVNKEEMDACLLENNYLLQDSNMFDYPKVKIIQDDFMQSQEAYVLSTPTMYVNGYYLTGVKDYNTFSNFIDEVKNTESLTLDYTDKSFSYDENTLKVYYIYDKESEIISKANMDYIEYLKTSEALIPQVNNVFNTIFNIEDVEYIDYASQEGKDILQTIDAKSLPAMYVLGDVSTLDFNDSESQEVFNFIFKKEEINNGYIIIDEVLPQLVMGSSFDGVYKLLDYSSLIKDSDAVLGSTDAEVSIVLFTDYDCPFCKQLETETLTDKFYENYMDTEKINLVIKPMVTNDVFSIFPILFLKCSEEQEVSLAVHRKLFELNPVIGVQTVYDLTTANYAEEMKALEAEYAIIMSSLEGN
jgi:hypothetical protein